MKQYIAIGILFFGVVVCSSAQDMERAGPLEEQIESQRVAFISQRMDLIPETAQKFWPIYNEYRAEEKALQRERTAQPRIAQMDDIQAAEFIKRLLVREQELLDLRAGMVSRLEGIVTPTQTLKLFQAERAFKERLVQMLKRQRQNGR